MTQLALTEFMAGRDRAATEVALEAFAMLGEDSDPHLRFAGTRAGLALFWSSTAALPWAGAPVQPPFSLTGRNIHHGDMSVHFWARMREALLAAWSGSVASARGVLDAPVADPRLRDHVLPRHLRVTLLVGRALLAALSADDQSLAELEADLRSLGAVGESCFVAGLRADARGDRRAAVGAFEQAAADATCVQPPVQALALVCGAQLLDSLDQPEEALKRLAEACDRTAVRRNGVAFLGWTRQGSPVEALLGRLAAEGGSEWARELAGYMAGRPNIISSLESSSLMRREEEAATPPPLGPPLSPREREVLGELARGATYADIGATLFLSANTVKTHISSLYSKLGVSRRSEALAIARAHHIL
jgi:DNA-binding CsgD family transcriptional regulator